MNWFKRKPTQQKYVEAAVTVATNLYLHTIPGEDECILPSSPLQFSLPDSRYRYLVFCLSAVVTAALVYDDKKRIQPETLIQGCLHFAAWTAREHGDLYFDDPAGSQASINSTTVYFQDFCKHWSQWPVLEKEAKSDEANDLISLIIHTTESNSPAGDADIQRLGNLALEINCRLPTMRSALIDLANG